MEVFLVGGENDFGSEQELSRILTRFRKEQKDVAVESYYADEISSLHEVGALAGAVGLFTKGETVLIKNLLSMGKAALRDEVLDYLERHLISTQSKEGYSGELKVILYEGSKIDKRSKLYKLLQKKFVVKEFAAATDADKQRQLEGALKQSGLSLSPEARAQFFTRLLPLTPREVHSEFEKLRLMLEYDGRSVIEVADLEIFSGDVDQEIWDLFKYAATDKPKAFALLENLWQREVHFSQIIGFLASQLRQFVYYYYLPEQLNPYVKKRLVPLTNKVSRAKLNILLSKLADLDLALKRGELDPKVGLVLYLSIV